VAGNTVLANNNDYSGATTINASTLTICGTRPPLPIFCVTAGRRKSAQDQERGGAT
jgi:autotransporter-associated beta strand protein